MASAFASNNPFRTPEGTPTPTGGSTANANASSHATESSLLAEDLPPAYTAGPDVRQGEHTLELGPARPFQQPGQNWLPPQRPPPQQTGGSSSQFGGGYAGYGSGSGSGGTGYGGGYTGNGRAAGLWQQLTGQIVSNIQAAVYPGQPSQQQRYNSPPHPPPSSPYLSPQAPSRPAPPLSDFARDFYATTHVPPGAFSDVSNARASSAEPTSYPPPPPLPPRRNSADAATYSPPSGPPPARNTVPDDGRPTTTPVPGHPLLLNGKLLVYPEGYECHKCKNTGYKHSDPSHPCTRCWDKYARPYAGALIAAPSANANSTAHGPTFQRPLPKLFAAGSRPVDPPSSSSYPGSSLSASGYPPPPLHPSHSLSHAHSHSYSQPSYPPPPPQPIAGLPAPAQALPPGDPRLGGAQCWRCSGRGRVPFLVFESMPCGACGGVGRVYR